LPELTRDLGLLGRRSKAHEPLLEPLRVERPRERLLDDEDDVMPTPAEDVADADAVVRRSERPFGEEDDCCHAALARTLHREEPPLPGDSFELRDAAVLDLDPRSGDEILDRARYEHLARLRARRDARARVHRDSRHLAVDDLALAGVKSRTHVGAGAVHRLCDRAGASDRARRPVE